MALNDLEEAFHDFAWAFHQPESSLFGLAMGFRDLEKPLRGIALPFQNIASALHDLARRLHRHELALKIRAGSRC
jgi:hypothetical protein